MFLNVAFTQHCLTLIVPLFIIIPFVYLLLLSAPVTADTTLSHSPISGVSPHDSAVF